MPRRPRNALPDRGVFHVTTNGVADCLIFLELADRDDFITLLGDVVTRFGWNLYAYCLMTTHYHVVVEGRRSDVSAGVHRLNGLYAQQFNANYERRGHLFRERFSSWLVWDVQHLERTIRYVLRNPVEAGLCARAEDWPWSWSRFGNRVDD